MHQSVLSEWTTGASNPPYRSITQCTSMKRQRSGEDHDKEPSPVSRVKPAVSNVRPRKSAKAEKDVTPNTSKPQLPTKLDSAASVCVEGERKKEAMNLVTLPPQPSKNAASQQNKSSAERNDSSNDDKTSKYELLHRNASLSSSKEPQQKSSISIPQQDIQSKSMRPENETTAPSTTAILPQAQESRTERALPAGAQEQPKRVSLSHDEETKGAASSTSHLYNLGGVPYNPLLLSRSLTTGLPSGAQPPYHPHNPYFAGGHPMAIAGPPLQQHGPISSGILQQFSQIESTNPDGALRVNAGARKDNQQHSSSSAAAGPPQPGQGYLSADSRALETSSELRNPRYVVNIPLQYRNVPPPQQQARMYYDTSARIGPQQLIPQSWHTTNQIAGNWPPWAPPTHDVQIMLRSMLSRQIAAVSEHNATVPNRHDDRSGASLQEPLATSTHNAHNVNLQSNSVGNIESATAMTNVPLTVPTFDPRVASRTTSGGRSFSDAMMYNTGADGSHAPYVPKNMMPLQLPSDSENLSAYQCFVRQQINLFVAQKEEIECSAQGRNRPIMIGQVGIICRHCASIRPGSRSRGAVYFPAKLSGLYQAAQNMVINHFTNTCRAMPEGSRILLLDLKEQKSSVLGGGKLYWANGARVLGVEEGESGLVLRKSKQEKDSVGK